MATALPEIETTKRDITNMIIFRIEYFHMFRTEYVLKMDFQLVTVCLTATLYLFCYLAALLKVRKQFSKMNIRQKIYWLSYNRSLYISPGQLIFA